LFVACGDGNKPPLNAENTITDAAGGSAGGSGDAEAAMTSGVGTPTSSGGSSGSGGTDSAASNTNGGGAPNTEGPSVELLTPEDESAPDTVYSADLSASCRVQAAEGGAAPDASTITLDLLDESGELIDSRVGELGENEDVYEAVFPTDLLPSGPIVVRCSAADMAETPNTSSVQVNTFIDHGPIVTIISPLPEAAKSALEPVLFEYEIVPDELGADDEGAAIEDVSLSVRALDFAITTVADEEDLWGTTIDFSDPDIFAETPNGPVLVILSVTNARGVTYVERYEFVLDSSPPGLSVVSPNDASMVGGSVDLTIRAVDGLSGVNWDSLVVSLNDQDFPYDPDGPWTPPGDEVTFTFESKTITGSIVQLNVNLRVQDNAGNQSSTSTLLYRDEFSPIISMDPVAFRDSRESSGGLQCSVAFDPLGDAVGQAADVQNLGLYRAIVWDRTNDAGGRILYYSGVNRNSVELFARRPDVPLVIDTTGDGVCDDINESEEELPFQELTALSPAGTAWFAPGTEDPILASQNPMPEGCGYGTSATAPATRCNGDSDIGIIVAHGTGDPAVYAVLPGTEEDCAGREWELPTIVPDYQGWVCLAVRAEDRVGNRGVSKPIAVCLDNLSVAGLPNCWAGAEAAPSCTDGCADPPDMWPVVIAP
jgi:hypothetical protein